jgi:hypothetical protein
MARNTWLYVPLLEIIVGLGILSLAPMCTFGLPLIPIPIDPFRYAVIYALNGTPYIAIVLLIDSLITLSSRPQWSRGSGSSRLAKNVLLMLAYLVVFPLIWWNTKFSPAFWGFSPISSHLMTFLQYPTGIYWYLVGALFNVVITIVVLRVSPRTRRTSTMSASVLGLLLLAIDLVLLASIYLSWMLYPWVVLLLAAYVGALIPALWPYYVLKR